MWRQSKFPADPHSDQSISDEDDFDASWPENCISLGGSAKEEGLQLPLRLEMLKGASELNRITEYSEDTSLERKVGIPDTSNLDEDVISDEEENDMISKITVVPRAEDLNTANLYMFGCEKGDGIDMKEWSTVIKEAKRTHSNVNAPCSSSYSTCFEPGQDYKAAAGLRSKAKPKFSFQNQSKSGCSKQENNVSSFVNEAFEKLENIKFRSMEGSLPEFMEDYPEEEEIQAETFLGKDESRHAALVKHSMVELLDGLQDNKHAAIGKSKKMFRHKGKWQKSASMNNVAKLNRTFDREGSSEPVDIGSSSSDEEVNFQNRKLVIPEMKKQTMADRFQEIVGASALNSEEFIFGVANQSGNGLHGMLQKVVQLQKEGDSDFFKKLQTGFDSGVSVCISIKIISKYLDGQMTVCECVFIQNEEFQQPEISQSSMYNELKRRTVIFNPRICSNVELEVGNLIRIIPPWKEVIGKAIDESIILSMYYCQI